MYQVIDLTTGKEVQNSLSMFLSEEFIKAGNKINFFGSSWDIIKVEGDKVYVLNEDKDPFRQAIWSLYEQLGNIIEGYEDHLLENIDIGSPLFDAKDKISQALEKI